MNTKTTISNEILLSHPASPDWFRIDSQIDWKRFELTASDFHLINDNSLDQFSRSINLESWIDCLIHRIFDIRKSYIFLMFYYEQGIPDDKWWSQETGSIRYFPDFELKHRGIKLNFDYYADAFYYKMSSAWDTIGQILNVAFNLKMSNNDVTFFKTHERIKNINTDLYNSLKLLMDENEYKKAKKIRNALTHNYPPIAIGSGVNMKPNSNKVDLGVGEYITSTEIKKNVVNIVEILAKAFEAIKK